MYNNEAKETKGAKDQAILNQLQHLQHVQALLKEANDPAAVMFITQCIHAFKTQTTTASPDLAQYHSPEDIQKNLKRIERVEEILIDSMKGVG